MTPEYFIQIFILDIGQWT